MKYIKTANRAFINNYNSCTYTLTTNRIFEYNNNLYYLANTLIGFFFGDNTFSVHCVDYLHDNIMYYVQSI